MSSIQPYVELEERFGQWIHCEHTVAVNSGTSALHLAIEALDLPYGSSIIVPDFSMIACARAVTLAGHKPIFADCTNKMLLDPKAVRQLLEWYKVSQNIEAIMPVHIYGRRCNMSDLHAIAKEYAVLLIEDMAEAHGIQPYPHSAAACWSFYKNKIVHGEEGGMVAFIDNKNNVDLVDRAKSLRSLGFTNAHDFTHIPRGINARLSNAHARLILSSLTEAGSNILARKNVADMYDVIMPDRYKLPYPREVNWVYDVIVNPSQQDEIVQGLNKKGISARHGFKRLSKQPEYINRAIELETYTPLASHLSKCIIYLPIEPDMTRDDVYKNVCEFVSLAKNKPLHVP